MFWTSQRWTFLISLPANRNDGLLLVIYKCVQNSEVAIRDHGLVPLINLDKCVEVIWGKWWVIYMQELESVVA